jgi:lytic murein transglycosylase
VRSPSSSRRSGTTWPRWSTTSASPTAARCSSRWRELLARVEAEYGVDPATVVAVWGVESDFGRRFGSRPLLESLSTLSCYGRRQPFFRGEFFTTLKIIQDGDVAPDRLKGSWAGAFGHTQFMPSTFMRLAVDFDGDGRRDLIDSVPDALASTANFLKRAGWRSELPWGFEVKLPAGFDAAAAGRRNKQPASAWAARGVRRVDGSALVAPNPADSKAVRGPAIGADTPAALLLPAGARGPAFLVTFRNFDALFSYNAAESYALAIAHLADRLRGGRRFHRRGRPTIRGCRARNVGVCRSVSTRAGSTSARWTGGSVPARATPSAPRKRAWACRSPAAPAVESWRRSAAEGLQLVKRTRTGSPASLRAIASPWRRRSSSGVIFSWHL